ncbi:MAG: HAMP domain-containing protein [Rhodospirillaceae bacterium]|jgi:methyl-accepting chemotaxis protein|nr:HAMP domain-containing protein [Rhodospirillaceae bacterium]MBT4489374.1 HAMP domain-containing protein [Rhodospirillaceae bacterium]MBT5191849.1 HAMP domain-containing protein [Rhodospirillaceae bacterium]MBT5896502.1 HAMP domain-containing protein [Rhodospirillaceae bacterium]MBT6427005.1 HAMP domain-containing protein [Rhodospirillaceae bacterium]
MKILNNLNIGGKLTIAVLLPVIGLLAYSSFLVFERYQKMNEMGRVQVLADFAPTISALVHELQKERGESAGFIGSKGNKFAKVLPGQRSETDSKRSAFEARYKSFAFTDFDGAFEAKASAIVSQLEQLQQMRGQVDDLRTSIPGMAKYYTGTISGLLSVVEEMLRNSSDDGVSKAISGYVAYLQAKERAGLERAMGAGGFGAGKFKPAVYNRFVELIALQKNYFKSFQLYATPSQWSEHERTLSGAVVAEVDRMRKIAIASPQTGDMGGIEGGYWFGAITKKINLMKQVEDHIASDLRTLAADLKSASLVGVIIFAVAGLALGIVGIGILVAVSRDILRATGGLTEAMGTLSHGDTSIEVPGIERGDEMGQMAEAVQVFKENMIRNDELVAEQKAESVQREQRARKVEQLAADFDIAVGDVLNGVSEATAEMDSTAKTMSATADQTIQQATTIAAASEQASVNVQTVASASEELSASIGEITRQVTDSERITSEAVEEAANTNVAMEGLNEAAQKIGDVVGLINDIASQTNLLALNATIEAARAGEAGKGFAVVASEVKNLANQTASATEEIGTQIATMQSETTGALEALTGIGKTIDTVNGIATTIAAAVEEQSAATQEISRNVDQAAQGTQEVSSNIATISQATSDTGAAASQVLAASGNLAEQANTLKATVEKFLLDVKAA